MKIALIGCGNVAAQYAKTLNSHPELNLVGAYDSNAQNVETFLSHRSGRRYKDVEEIRRDQSVDLVINLTNPRSHFMVTRALLLAGKHVYSEKPLAMTTEDATTLVELAKRNGLYLASAPSSILGETAQTLWKAIRDGLIGTVRLVYANFDDGMIAPNMAPWTWTNEYGVPWPAKDEFEVGCTYEHGGYVLTWLAALFGPALSVTSFASCQIPHKGIPVDGMAPDLTISCIEYANNIVARVTCGLVAPKDRSLTIVGDHGVISTNNVRNEVGPVYVRQIPPSRVAVAIEHRLNGLRRVLEDHLPYVPWSGRDWHFQKSLPLQRVQQDLLKGGGKVVDFCRGPSEMVAAITEKRPCRLSAELGLHLVELVQAIQYPRLERGKCSIKSTFHPIEPVTAS